MQIDHKEWKWSKWKNNTKSKSIELTNNTKVKYLLLSPSSKKKRNKSETRTKTKLKNKLNTSPYSNNNAVVLFKLKGIPPQNNNMITSSTNFYRKTLGYMSCSKKQEIKVNNGGNKQDNYGHKYNQKADLNFQAKFQKTE